MAQYPIRLFVRKDCKVCQYMSEMLDFVSLTFTKIDAEADENDSLCEEVGVYWLPTLQVLGDDGKPKFQREYRFKDGEEINVNMMEILEAATPDLRI